MPIFVDLGNNTKQTLERGISVVQTQAQNDFPFLDSLPLHAGKIIRNEFDTNIIARMILSEEKTSLITTNITENLGLLQSLTKKGF